MGKKNKRISVSQRLFNEGKDFFKKYENDVTRQCYTKNFKRFVSFCRERYKVENLNQCQNHIQDYIDYLKSEKKCTPSTIHTYAMPPCLFFGIGINNYNKPKRRTADYIRGRSDNGRIEHAGNDFANPLYSRLVEFQKKVGLRRAELKRLKGSDLTTDESGYPVIKVRSKGGKITLQKVLDTDFIKPYFEGKAPDEKVFSSKEFRNNLNLHRLRAECAQNAYKYYAQRLENEGDSYRTQLENELRKRLLSTNLDKKTGKPKGIKEQYLHGKYFCRGKNKELCKKLCIPWVYDKLALMAVSVFHLSHNRLDVSLESYMLAH